MQIIVTSTLEEISRHDLKAKTALVIDVLRATTTIITALANGAQKVVPFLEPEQALYYKKSNACVLGGERKSCIIPGFDCGNSPFEYTTEKIAGKTFVISTTNGTRALHAVREAEHIYLAALVNAGAVAKRIIAEKRDCVIVCSGTEGYFSSDDFLAAGAILYKAKEYGEVHTNDLGDVAQLWYEKHKDFLVHALKNCFHGRRLLNLGLEHDIDFCAKEDIFAVVPKYNVATNEITIA